MLTQAYPHSVSYRQTINRMGWSMVFFIPVFRIFSSIALAVDVEAESIPSNTMHSVFLAIYGLLSAACYIAPFLLTGLFYYLLSHNTRSERVYYEVRLPAEFPLLILAGLAILSAGAYVNAWFCSVIGYVASEDAVYAVYYDNPRVIIDYMNIALAPAFAEEFLFRGVFYANLRPYGRTQAILLSSLLFALMHQNIAQLFYTFVAGVAMALMYELTQSIWCSVFFHMFNNQLSVFKNLAVCGRFGEDAPLYFAIFDGVVLLLGIISIVVLITHYKKNSEKQALLRSRDGLARRNAAAQRFDRPLPMSSALRGALSPGMIVFTAITATLMVVSYLAVLLQGG